jgi:hypothetical protein
LFSAFLGPDFSHWKRHELEFDIHAWNWKEGEKVGVGIVLRKGVGWGWGSQSGKWGCFEELTRSLNVWKQALREPIVTFHDFE